MGTETVFKNARVVLEHEVILGTVVINDGQIIDVSSGTSSIGEDFEGDYLIPGLVELHTDHLETHYSPRPGVKWNKTAAIQAHDAQIACSGITTVFDCLRLGTDGDSSFSKGEMRSMADAIDTAQRAGRLRAEHFIHLRCEVASSDVIEQFADFEQDPNVRLLSMMDHSPGQRQFQSLEQYALFYKTTRGYSDEAFAELIQRRQTISEKYSAIHRDTLAVRCIERGITIASHDDARIAHVNEAIGHGVKLAEFPTSLEAAQASHSAGMSVLMGAPNIVRGKSHSGNIAAKDLAAHGVLDVLSSDYVPFSLVIAPFILADELDTVSLPKAISMVTSTPARTVGLLDRGRIAKGLRADLIRVFRQYNELPIVRAVWSNGKRVA